MTAPLTVDIWSDVMCPWCIIGFKQLEKALAELEGEVSAQIRWHPFELNPDMPPQGEDSASHIARKYGRSPEQAAAGRAQMASIAAAAGYSFAYAGTGDAPAQRMWNTFAAHKLLTAALRDHGGEAQTRLKLAMFDAHFQQRRDLSDETVLTEIFVGVGLPADEATAALADPALGEIVRAEEARAWDMNISGVPAIVFNGKYLVPGAQDPETYVTTIRRVLQREAAVAG